MKRKVPIISRGTLGTDILFVIK